MNTLLRTPALLLSAGAVLAAAGLVSAPAPSARAADAGVCTVSSGELSWGVKESFRSYISGSIAKGDWQASDGAEYTTPQFHFTAPVGEIDAATGAGTVTFAGTVHFTGHDGILDMTLASPSIVISSDGSAIVQLDVRSSDTSGELALDEKQAEVGSLTADPSFDSAAGELSASAVPLVLTEAGAPAFGGFYEAGDDLDPITFDVALDCAPAAAGADGSAEADDGQEAEEEPSSAPADAGSTDADSGGVDWLPIALGGVVAVVVVSGALLLRRRRQAVDSAQGESGH